MLGKKYTIYLQPDTSPFRSNYRILMLVNCDGMVKTGTRTMLKRCLPYRIVQGRLAAITVLGYSEALFRIYKSAITESTSAISHAAKGA